MKGQRHPPSFRVRNFGVAGTGTEAQRGGGLCLVLVVVLLLVLAPYSFADDVGNAPASAELLSTGSVTRVINRHDDRDVFQFSVLPYVTNAITVSTGTVWDCEMELLSPSGASVVLFTNSVVGGSNTVVVLHTGSAQRAYLSVKSLAEFTTGTYYVALAHRFTDADGDGLPDAWEQAKFGSLTNTWTGGDADGDGFADDAEWLAGTNPGDASSALRIQALLFATNWTHVTWTSQPEGLYRVSSAASPTSLWSVVPDLVLAESNLTTRPVAGATTSAVFRVEFVY